jgi:putative transcriptional regulator
MGEDLSISHTQEIEPASIKAIRKNAGMTQKAFGDAIGVPESSIRNWEQGRREPTGAAKVLLRLLCSFPEVVGLLLEALPKVETLSPASKARKVLADPAFEMVPEFIDAISPIHDAEQVRDCFLEFTSRLGYDQTAYGFFACVEQGNYTYDRGIVLTNYDPEYMRVYEEESFAALDETVEHCMVSTDPYRWERIETIRERAAKGEYTPEQLSASEYTWDSGLQKGVTLPLERNLCAFSGAVGMHSTTLSWAEHENYPEERLRLLHQIAQLFHAHVRKNLRIGNLDMSTLLNLTEQEREYLQLLVNGVRRKDMQAIFAVKMDRINAIHAGVMKKLACKKLENGVARALVFDMVDIDTAGATFTLDDRELDCVRYVALGYPARAIAEKMHISHHTVYNYRASIQKKMDARTPAQAVANALALYGNIL